MIQTSHLGKVAQHVDQLYGGRLALPQALLLSRGHGLLAVSGKAGDDRVKDGMAVEVGPEVPHELGFDGEKRGDHYREEEPTLNQNKKRNLVIQLMYKKICANNIMSAQVG